MLDKCKGYSLLEHILLETMYIPGNMNCKTNAWCFQGRILEQLWGSRAGYSIPQSMRNLGSADRTLLLPEASSSNRNAWACPQCHSLRQHGTLCRDRLCLNCSCPAALQQPAEPHCSVLDLSATLLRSNWTNYFPQLTSKEWVVNE